jgi:hypothetical protein
MPALPFPMVGRIAEQHSNRAIIRTALRPNPLPTTSYPLLSAAEPKQLSPSSASAPLSLLFSAASGYFPSPRECIAHIPDLQMFGPSNMPTRLFTGACRLFGFSFEFSPFVYKGLQPLFAKHPGGGVGHSPSPFFQPSDISAPCCRLRPRSVC